MLVMMHLYSCCEINIVLKINVNYCKFVKKCCTNCADLRLFLDLSILKYNERTNDIRFCIQSYFGDYQ